MNINDSDFKKTFEAAPGLSIILQPDFTIAAVSDAYLKVAGASRDAILGQGFFDVFPDSPDQEGRKRSKSLRESLERVLKNRIPDALPALKYDSAPPASKSGEIKYWASVNTPILVNGKIVYILRQVEDKTAAVRREGEQKVIEQERDLLFSYSFDLLGIVGNDGYFKKVNPSFESTFGYSAKELLSKPITHFLHPDDVDKTMRGIQILASGSSTIESKNRYRCRDGSYKWISWNTVPMGILFYTVGRNITEQVESEARIKELNRQLERKNEDLEMKIEERMTDLKRSEAQVLQLQKMDAIGRLAGGIAHDFNNMLAAMAMYCDGLEEKEGLSPEFVREKADDMRKVIVRATALTRQLLTFSRQQVVQRQSIGLNPLIQQLEKMLVRLIGENIKIVSKLAENLNSIDADPSQMEQVVLNLVVNAKDAMPQGGIISIETSNVYLDEEFSSSHLTVKKGHYVLLTVSDTGLGMDAQTRAKIFEPFFTTKPIGKGTGLGLSTTYGIVKQSNGTIWVYSEPGKGTVFKIYLPVAEAVEVVPELTAVSPLELKGGQTILLVEDDSMLRASFTAVLKKRGYNVLVTSDGDEALKVCESHSGPIHLLLTDMVMPGLSGLQVAKRAMELRNDIHVLYMSGYMSDTLQHAGVQDTVQMEFIQKPFSTKALVAKVQDILSRELKPNLGTSDVG